MNKQRFNQIKIEWEKLNQEYDDLIRYCFDNPENISFTPNKLKAYKEMQQKLYDLEQEIFRIM